MFELTEKKSSVLMNILHFWGNAVINEYHTPILAQHKILFHAML